MSSVIITHGDPQIQFPILHLEKTVRINVQTLSRFCRNCVKCSGTPQQKGYFTWASFIAAKHARVLFTETEKPWVAFLNETPLSSLLPVTLIKFHPYGRSAGKFFTFLAIVGFLMIHIRVICRVALAATIFQNLWGVSGVLAAQLDKVCTLLYWYAVLVSSRDTVAFVPLFLPHFAPLYSVI